MVNCGGLYSDRIARMAGVGVDARIVPFRGEYFKLRKEKESLVKSLIYPVPDPELPFLGIHFTRTIHDEVKAGPNAVLALSREGYRRRDVSLKDLADTAFYGGFWRMMRKYWKMGVAEFYRSANKRVFAKALGRFIPEISAADLVPGPSGLRAQCVDANGALVNDFKILEGPRSLHVINVPSPAATACLAIADYILTSKALAFSN
jgi:L-2-hydroxyglutarate oxidase